MKFSLASTYANALLICALLSPGLPAQAVVPDETITITLDQAVHFIGTDGSDVIANPGDYSVEATQEWLRLIPGTERRDALLIEAQPGTHEVKVEIPIVISTPGTEPDELDIHIVQLLNPDGISMVAAGTYSGIQSRGFGDRAKRARQAAAKRARAKAEAARRVAAAKAKKTAEAARIAALKAKQAAEQAARKAAQAAREKLRVLAEIKAQAGKGLGTNDAKAAAREVQAYLSKLLKAGWTGPTKDHGLAAVRAAKISSRGTSPIFSRGGGYLSSHTYHPGTQREWTLEDPIYADGFTTECVQMGHRGTAEKWKKAWDGERYKYSKWIKTTGQWGDPSYTNSYHDQVTHFVPCKSIANLSQFQLKAYTRVGSLSGESIGHFSMYKDFYISPSTTGNPNQVQADFHFIVNRSGLLRVLLAALAETSYHLTVRILDLTDDYNSVEFEDIDDDSKKQMWKEIYSVPIPVGDSNRIDEARERILSPTLIRGHTYRLSLELNLTSNITIGNFLFWYQGLIHAKSDFLKDEPFMPPRSVGLSYLRVKIYPDPLEP